MPLQLLGKKSWNVYNPQNIARVRQDEAEAKAKDEKAEHDIRNGEAASRLQALRGEKASRSPSRSSNDVSGPRPHSRSHDVSRKRRKIAGEDDTDRDIRLAQVDAQARPSKQDEAGLFDSTGHIDLVPEHRRAPPQRGESRKEERPQGMRFKDATGYKSDGKPWYTDKSTLGISGSQDSKDVWGNEDPRKHQREQQRTNSNDPLLAMKRGVKQLRENEKQRKEWIEQREKDMYEVERLARRKRRRSRQRSDEHSLVEFSLDGPSKNDDETRAARLDREMKRRRHEHRHRHRSGSPERAQSHRHRQSRHRSDDC